MIFLHILPLLMLLSSPARGGLPRKEIIEDPVTGVLHLDYLGVPGFQKCYGTKSEGSYSVWCFPFEKPAACNSTSWMKMITLQKDPKQHLPSCAELSEEPVMTEEPVITVEAVESGCQCVQEISDTTENLEKKIEELENQRNNFQDQLATLGDRLVKLQILAHSREVCFEDVASPKCEGSQSGQVGIVEAIRVDGGWGPWQEWTRCSATCGGGSQVRNRTCDNPEPHLGGKTCPGFGEDGRKCNEEECCPDGMIRLNGECSECDGTWEFGIEYNGHDIRSCSRNKRPTPEACQRLCQSVSGCVGWEWGYDKDNCCIKSNLRNRASGVGGRVAGTRNSCKPEMEEKDGPCLQAKRETPPRPLPPITDLGETLTYAVLLAEFKNYLLKTLKKFEPMLQYLVLCRRVFHLAEDDVDTKVQLMVKIYTRFLTPNSYNIALRDQNNRRDLIAHCRDLMNKVEDTPNIGLLRPGYEYLFGILERKHDLWRRSYKPPTTTAAALLCNNI